MFVTLVYVQGREFVPFHINLFMVGAIFLQGLADCDFCLILLTF